MLLKLGNLICAHADFVKFCSQQNNNNNNNNDDDDDDDINTYCIQKYILSRKIRISQLFFPFALRCTFTFLCLVICWNLWSFFEI